MLTFSPPKVTKIKIGQNLIALNESAAEVLSYQLWAQNVTGR